MFFNLKIRMFLIAAMLACVAAVFVPCPAMAGLETPTADIEVNNLGIGKVYNLTQMGGMPFRVKATNMEYRINISLIAPATAQCRVGFEPVPDLGWVNLTKNDFTLLPGETGSTDITIRVPDDEKLLGRRFEVKVLAVTAPRVESGANMGASFGLGVMGSLRFTILPRPLTEEEKKKFEKAKYRIINLGLTPNDLFLDGEVPVGKKYDVEKQAGKFLKLVNTGEEAIKVRVKSIPVQETGIKPPVGWEIAPDAGFLVIPKYKVKVNPLEVKKLPFMFTFPNDEQYRNKRYLFVVEVYVEDELVRTSYRSKIYVPTK